MSLLKDFRKHAIGDFDKALKRFDNFFSEIDIDELEEEIQSSQKFFKNQFNILAKKFKNYVDKYVVTIPYDRNDETLQFKIDGQELTITVKTLDDVERQEERTTTITLPSDVDPTAMSHSYDKEEQKMRFVFKKKGWEEVEQAAAEEAAETDEEVEEATELSPEAETVEDEPSTPEEELAKFAKNFEDAGLDKNDIVKLLRDYAKNLAKQAKEEA